MSSVSRSTIDGASGGRASGRVGRASLVGSSENVVVRGGAGMRRLGLVLLSGGLDSTTVAAMAAREGYDLSAVTVHYGQAHAREVESARRVAEALGINQRVMDLTFFRDLAWYSALTHPERFALPAE